MTTDLLPAAAPSAPQGQRRRRYPRGPRPSLQAAHLRPVAEWTVVPTRVLLLCSGLAMWLLAYVFLFSRLQEGHAQYALYDNFRQQLASGTAPVGGAITPGRPVALLTVPAAGVHRVVVVEGTTSAITRNGPGHLRNTALPGQGGVSTIFGRATTFGGPFAHVVNLQPGDAITVTTGQGVFTYSVTDVRQNGDPLAPTLTSGTGRLMLVTTSGSALRASGSPEHAVYVDAALNGRPAPTPGGRPSAISRAESQFATDASEHTYIQVVLWLQVAVLVTGGFAWAWHRWARGSLWVGGMPVLVAVLWSLTSATVPLLPNLL